MREFIYNANFSIRQRGAVSYFIIAVVILSFGLLTKFNLITMQFFQSVLLSTSGFGILGLIFFDDDLSNKIKIFQTPLSIIAGIVNSLFFSWVNNKLIINFNILIMEYLLPSIIGLFVIILGFFVYEELSDYKDKNKLISLMVSGLIMVFVITIIGMIFRVFTGA